MASQSLIAIVGPTASGKTRLALSLARRLGGEVVSADLGQMYRHLDAGTGRPAGTWEPGPGGKPWFVYEGVPHHLMDILDPKESMDAARFASLAREAVQGILSRGRRPIVAGGTGLYLKALIDGLDPLPSRDPGVREELAELAEANGREWLHEELSRVDPEAARRIPPGNLQRVMRALEVHRLTGKPISSLWSGPKSSGSLHIGLSWERAALAGRIRERCEGMLPRMIEEASFLVPSRYTGGEPGFRCLGYRQALACAAGEMIREQALASMVKDTLDYAKRQATWFRRQASVHWIEAAGRTPEDIEREALAAVDAAA